MTAQSLGMTAQSLGMNDHCRKEPLRAISPIDGRYCEKTAPLEAYFSEYALIKERVTLEILYLLALSDLPELPISLSSMEKTALTSIYRQFTIDDARRVRQIERVGTEETRPTDHDVKAVEYYLREQLKKIALTRLIPWIHFGLTSEDIDNLAYNRLLKRAIEAVILPALCTVQQRLLSLAEEYKELPLLAHTHGRPASPTTLGKEFALYLYRLTNGVDHLASLQLSGKVAGATGNLSAHRFAYPEVDWLGFTTWFVTQLELQPTLISTQIEAGDNQARLFFSVVEINNILLDLVVDIWLYSAKGYLRVAGKSGAIGSSTMPHKVNPIDFENSEGNLAKANADLSFLATFLPRSRLQRDLSGSTARRTIGTALAHALLGYQRIAIGLSKVTAEKEMIRAELDHHFEVLSEPMQTVMRRSGEADAFERVKEHFPAGAIGKTEFAAILSALQICDKSDPLFELQPADYIGFAVELAELAIEKGRASIDKQIKDRLQKS
ncbi:adenylosuccinate lyase [Candidatus Bipolaricaulota bacterium]|nr:adenylosuccinate lyase [Candidatus Bipolaricaulota bacterium]